MSTTYLQILSLSLIYAILMGGGFYGFGHDFYSAYWKPNLAWGNFQDQLGYMMSTLTIFKIHLGVYLSAFVLSYSSGLLLLKATNRYFYGKYWLFLLIFLMLIHTWPIFMSTSNGMRQGFSMSFLFLSLYFLMSKKYILYVLSIGLCITTHKSGMVFATLLAGVSIYNNQLQNQFSSIITQRNLLIAAGFLVSLVAFILLPIIWEDHTPSRIIYGDYRYPFLLINIVYILVFVKYLFTRADQIDIFLLMCSFLFPIFLFHGWNWQYERFCMSLSILYMISFSRVFVPHHVKIVLFFATTSFLFLTGINGMWASFK